MENNYAPQDPVQRPVRPSIPLRPAQLITRRPVLDGFVTHRQSMPPRPLGPQPAGKDNTPTPRNTGLETHPRITPPAHTNSPQRRLHVPMAPSRPLSSGGPEFTGMSGELSPTTPTKPPKEPNRTAHAGLVGSIVFLLLGALLLSPLVPGKTIQNFPLSSEAFSTGEESLDCLGTQRSLTTHTTYNSRAGSPVTWTYSTSTTQSATCNDMSQSAVIGHTSQSSPLALLLDAASALVAAIVVAKVWRRLFGETRTKR